MHALRQNASTSRPTPHEAFAQSRQARNAEDLAYQSLTVAAILLLLGSLWVF